MQYANVVTGRFIRRVNRFIAHVYLEGSEQIVHVKNTGRCKEILLPGAAVILERAVNPARKTPYSLIGVYKDDRLINIDSQVPVHTVYEGLVAGDIQDIGYVNGSRKEVVYRKSRFDLYYETARGPGFIEVKGVTLEKDGVAMFPDAPTVRGTKHVVEMIDAVGNGYEGCIFFLIQMKGVRYFTPFTAMDPAFAKALTTAACRGVKILAYDSIVRENEILLGHPVEVRLTAD